MTATAVSLPELTAAVTLLETEPDDSVAFLCLAKKTLLVVQDPHVHSQAKVLLKHQLSVEPTFLAWSRHRRILFIASVTGEISALAVSADYSSCVETDILSSEKCGPVVSLTYDPLNDVAVSVTRDAYLVVGDCRTGLTRQVLLPPPKLPTVVSARYSVQRGLVFVACEMPAVAVFDATSRKVGALEGHSAPVTLLSLDDVRGRVFACCTDKSLCAWLLGPDPTKNFSPQLTHRVELPERFVSSTVCQKTGDLLGTDLKQLRVVHKGLIKASMSVSGAHSIVPFGSGGVFLCPGKDKTLMVVHHGNGEVESSTDTDSGDEVTKDEPAAPVKPKRFIVDVRLWLFQDFLHFCATGNVAGVKKLLKKGVEVDRQTVEEGNTCLHVATSATVNTISTIQCLLEEGKANIWIQNHIGQTALHLARDAASCRALISNASADLLHLPDSDGCYPLHMASQNADASLLEFILDKGAQADCADKRGRTPLHLSAGLGLRRNVEQLLLRNADPNRQELSEGNAPLHIAARLADSQGPRIVQLLLGAGARPNAKNHMNETPLHIACKVSNAEVVRLLLAAGAVAAMENSEGQKPAELAESAAVKALVEGEGGDRAPQPRSSLERLASPLIALTPLGGAKPRVPTSPSLDLGDYLDMECGSDEDVVEDGESTIGIPILPQLSLAIDRSSFDMPRVGFESPPSFDLDGAASGS
eukprot:CAMPEP_0177684800 /NCGR_PEP_ID=MMETSP0447-20121125/32626_1 /TAXON_ID=0 /ORGANISM="Stygamoeba regulata, Strain BSH-02190019" /LENGTH=700 /DNA_ID=CAMNT_0019194675 /DNA_START=192 /DNA_END=2291 /DNA_ORIENTATION=+